MCKRTLEQRGERLVEKHAIVAAVVLVAGWYRDAFERASESSRHACELAAVGALAEVNVGKTAYNHIFDTFGQHHFAQCADVQGEAGKLVVGLVVEVLELRAEECDTMKHYAGEVERGERLEVSVQIRQIIAIHLPFDC